MTATRQAEALQQFRRLHQDGILLLANAWDAGSARLIESLGAQAVATTSAGVAWAHGYPDGDALPLDLLVATTADIARIIRAPLTVDAEGGYGADPAAVGEAVARLIGAGAAGINIEDGAGTPDLLCAKIEAIKRAAARSGQDVFVNARTDVYLRGLAPEGGRVAEALARAERYRAAGADGLFVPGVTKPEEIRAIAAGTPLPLNVMARPGLPGAAELSALGVRRLSAGAAIAQAVLARTAALAKPFLQDGVSDPVVAEAMPYPEINALMAGR
ncbi:isocitrate lyase/phosphoenolpyruvate mutase family protein [Inquilinus limosus]|uniref:isocitrate lyase/PEP mutase family protein n=1 Tax=Inquilinus limosus TaxID=171674 RepID=UPI003F180D76